MLAFQIVFPVKSVDMVVKCFDNGVCRYNCWLRDVFVLEVYDVQDACDAHSLDKDKVCAIVLVGSTHVPAIHGLFS